MAGKFSKWVKNTVGKGEFTFYEQFLFFPQCFQKTLKKTGLVWERVKSPLHKSWLMSCVEFILPLHCIKLLPACQNLVILCMKSHLLLTHIIICETMFSVKRGINLMVMNS